jgi:hypothetical protein
VKTIIPLKEIDLIKEFYPSVNINSLFIVEKNSVHKDTYSYVTEYFKNAKLFADGSHYYILNLNIVMSLPYDYEIEYNDYFPNRLILSFIESKEKGKSKNAILYLNMYYSFKYGTNKHIFHQLFTTLYKHKYVSDIDVPYINLGKHQHYPVFVTYYGMQFKLSFYIRMKGGESYVSVNYKNFSKEYLLSKFSIDNFVLEFINEKEYNCSNINEMMKSLPELVELKSMQEL